MGKRRCFLINPYQPSYHHPCLLQLYVVHREYAIHERGTLDPIFDADEPAYGELRNTMNTTGWAFLEIHTNPYYNDTATVFAAGFLEG